MRYTRRAPPVFHYPAAIVREALCHCETGLYSIRERYGSRRGALSGLVEEAVLRTLERFDTATPMERFRALKGAIVVAEGDSLEQLAATLKHAKVDPRSVRIVSSVHLAPVARAGFRARKT